MFSFADTGSMSKQKEVKSGTGSEVGGIFSPAQGCFFSVGLFSSKAREHETDIHLYNLQPFKSVSDRNENNGDGDSIAFIHNVYIYIYIYFTKKTETSNLCVYIHK